MTYTARLTRKFYIKHYPTEWTYKAVYLQKLKKIEKKKIEGIDGHGPTLCMPTTSKTEHVSFASFVPITLGE